MRSTRRFVALCVVPLLLLVTWGCEDTSPSPEQRQAIEIALKSYLNALTAAYSNMNASLLEGHATASEIAAVHGLLKTLAASGDRVKASLRNFSIEDLVILRAVNSTVRLTEVWEVTRYDVYTGREKGHNPSSVQRSIVQMRLVDGKWLVTGRQVQETQGAPQWQAPTPQPAAGEEGV